MPGAHSPGAGRTSPLRRQGRQDQSAGSAMLGSTALAGRPSVRPGHSPGAEVSASLSGHPGRGFVGSQMLCSGSPQLRRGLRRASGSEKPVEKRGHMVLPHNLGHGVPLRFASRNTRTHTGGHFSFVPSSVAVWENAE